MEVAKECVLMQKADNIIPGTLDDRDFETACDTLASLTGLIYSLTTGSDQRCELEFITNLLYHVSALLRNEFNISSEEMITLITYSKKYEGFRPKEIVLPLHNSTIACYYHLARSKSEEILIMLHKFNDYPTKGNRIDSRLFDIFNSLSNYFFCMSMYLTVLEEKVTFVSRVY